MNRQSRQPSPTIDSQSPGPYNEEVVRLSKDEVKEFLAEETLFQGASPAVIERLGEVALQKVVPKNCRLFSMGQACDSLHFVADGSGLLVKTAPDGRQLILHRANAGDMVGCVPFFDGKDYPASFVAESECVVLSFPRDKLLGLFASEPALSLAVVGALVNRLRMMASMVEQLSFEDTEERLWDYLVENSRSFDDKAYPRVLESLPTREHIASAIGTVREVVSRRLSRLVDTGHVKIEGRTLTLLKPLK